MENEILKSTEDNCEKVFLESNKNRQYSYQYIHRNEIMKINDNNDIFYESNQITMYHSFNSDDCSSNVVIKYNNILFNFYHNYQFKIIK